MRPPRYPSPGTAGLVAQSGQEEINPRFFGGGQQVAIF
jgi:hypothetical protein